MRVYNRFQIGVLSICLVLATSGFIAAFSTPIGSAIVVTFGQTENETAALEVLKEEIPNAIVVGFGGFEYNNLKTRAIGPVIYVGHGNDDGIMHGDALVSVDDMDTELRTCTASKIVILACNSDIIAARDETGRTHGFGYIIDAELAALETVIRIDVFYGHIDSALRTFDRLIDTAMSKISGESSILALYLDDGDGGGGTLPPWFSDAEIWNAIRIFVIGLVFALIGFGISVAITKLGDSIARTVCYYTVGGTQMTKMQQIFSLIKTCGISFLNQAVNTVYGGYYSMAVAWVQTSVDALEDWISNLSVLEWALLIGICLLETLVVILTAGEEAVIRLVVGIEIALINAGIIAISDALDVDGIPCKSLIEAISQLVD